MQRTYDVSVIARRAEIDGKEKYFARIITDDTYRKCPSWMWLSVNEITDGAKKVAKFNRQSRSNPLGVVKFEKESESGKNRKRTEDQIELNISPDDPTYILPANKAITTMCLVQKEEPRRIVKRIVQRINENGSIKYVIIMEGSETPEVVSHQQMITLNKEMLIDFLTDELAKPEV